MNYFVLLTFLLFGQQALARELKDIELITPVSYTRPSSFSQTVKSKFIAGTADLFRIDIAKKAKAKVAPFKKDLLPYFSSEEELEKFITQVTNDGVNRHLKNVTDDNLIRFYRDLGNNLIGKIADKILEKQGVKDETRRSAWVRKITEPFNFCVDTSINAQYDANHCIEALTASLIPSIGIGIVYELSVSNLNASLQESEKTPFNQERVNDYKSCIAKTKSTSKDVTNCAIDSMRTGINKVTDATLSQTITNTASSPQQANRIKRLVWPNFDRCTQKVGSSTEENPDLTAEFTSCIDKLITETGTNLVEDKISNTPAVKDALGQTDANRLAAQKSAEFKQCAEKQLRERQRRNGMLNVAPCENKITNEVTLLVVNQTLKKTANDSFKNDPREASRIEKEGERLLKSCWSNKQTPEKREECLRNTILKFSSSVAKGKLDFSIPEQMPNRQQLTTRSLTFLDSCLQKELPENISSAPDLTKRIDKCSGSLTKNVAIQVAEYQIRDVAKAGLTKQESDSLVNRFVTKEFQSCLGENPKDDIIEKCVNQLTINASNEISNKSFTKEVNGYVQKAGGLSALGLTQRTVDQFINKLSKENEACLRQRFTGVAMDHVNSCVKGSIQKIAFFFGEAQFEKGIGTMYDNRANDKQKLHADFKQKLEQCLATRNGKEYTINDYTENLYTCAEAVADTTTRTVATDQIDTSLGQYIKDRPNINNAAKRQELRTQILGNFDRCMKDKTPAAQCIDSLKKEATKDIVLNYGRLETQEQLNTKTMPAELKPIEEKFAQCTETNKAGDALAAHLDECTQGFALGFAKELGILKLNYLLKQALGSENFNENRPVIDETISRYTACLDNLKQYSMADGLTTKLGQCTDNLTNRGMNIVRNSINQWMTSEEKDAATDMIKSEFAIFLPCLSALLPASPYTPQLEANIQSSVKPLAVLLAQYIDYNPENAKETLDEVVRKLSIDLSDVSRTHQAKAELLDFLYENGGLDQFLKSLIRGSVIEGLKGVSKDEVPTDIRNVLLQKENFEKIFNSPEGEEIKKQVMKNLLRPALLEAKDLSSNEMKNNMEQIKNKVVETLINAPSFGEEILKTGVQVQINKMSGFTKFFAKALYGGDSLVWENVRQTEAGQRAENHIKENVLMPKFKGEALSPAANKKAMDEAKELVTNAVKSYRKTK